MKPLLVGELNPYGADPRYALYPLPEGATGHRLQLILGMTMREYLRTFDRVNLCTGKWSAKEARRTALDLAYPKRRPQERRPVILLGAKAARAFALQFEPFNVFWIGSSAFRGVLILPHPSGRNRLWNVAGNRERARDAVRALLAS